MKHRPAEYRVLRFWKTVDLDIGFAATYDIVPEKKVRSDTISDILFDAIVAAVKKAGCEYELYTVHKDVVERSAAK